MKLRRWEMTPGSSKGSWIIPQVEGLVVFRSDGGWQLVAFGFEQMLPRSVKSAPCEAWGRSFTGEKAKQLIEDNPRLQGSFKSRAAALHALEDAVSRPSPSRLSELL